MSLRPEQLRKFVVSDGTLNTIAREQLSMIDNEIRKKVSYGRNVVDISLETNFINLSLEREDAQRIIYCHIIKSLEKRGFKEVRISIKSDNVTLYVGFNLSISPEQITSMDKILQSHHIRDDELEKFYTTTSITESPVVGGGDAEDP